MDLYGPGGGGGAGGGQVSSVPAAGGAGGAAGYQGAMVLVPEVQVVPVNKQVLTCGGGGQGQNVASEAMPGWANGYFR